MSITCPVTQRASGAAETFSKRSDPVKRAILWSVGPVRSEGHAGSAKRERINTASLRFNLSESHPASVCSLYTDALGPERQRGAYKGGRTDRGLRQKWSGSHLVTRRRLYISGHAEAVGQRWPRYVHCELTQRVLNSSQLGSPLLAMSIPEVGRRDALFLRKDIAAHVRIPPTCGPKAYALGK